MKFENLQVKEDDKFKICKSSDYNYLFDKKSGFFARWGVNKEDDPQYAPSAEILDLEISVNGCPNNCPGCYKSNTNEKPTNMSFDDFKKIIDKVSATKILGQVAFGITGIKTNPDFVKMMEYCRSIQVIPNFTLSGIDLDDEMAQKCANLVGALAVSAYQSDKNVCYNTVKKFTDLGVSQTNIHLVLSQESIDFCYEVLNDTLTDKRLEKLNCVVFLGLKPKGRAKGKFHPLEMDKFKKLVKFCFDKGIKFGFDSCSCAKYEVAIEETDSFTEEQKKQLIQMGESCESFGLFSSYINVSGMYYPCSFTEGEAGWEKGIDVLNCNDFIKDVWQSEKVKKWRELSLSTCYSSGCRKCLIFPDINPDTE